MNGFNEPGMWKVSSNSSMSDADDLDLSRLPDRPKLLERQKSCDERSMNELSVNIRSMDSYDNLYSPRGMRSGFNTPTSLDRHPFEPLPIIGEAWEALRRSIVYFKGEPVGTIAAFDHASEEVLNYDQVIFVELRFSYYIVSVHP